MTFTKGERSMLLVALDNLVCDCIKTERRAKRNKAPALAGMAAEAVARYRKLAEKVAREQPKGKR